MKRNKIKILNHAELTFLDNIFEIAKFQKKTIFIQKSNKYPLSKNLLTAGFIKSIVYFASQMCITFTDDAIKLMKDISE